MVNRPEGVLSVTGNCNVPFAATNSINNLSVADRRINTQLQINYTFETRIIWDAQQMNLQVTLSRYLPLFPAQFQFFHSISR